MKSLIQLMKMFGPDIWYGVRAFVRFVINAVFWFFILMFGCFLWDSIIPHSFNHNPNWLHIFILYPLGDLIFIFYMIVSFLWVFNPKITEEQLLIFKIFYSRFESVFNFRSWQNFLRGVLIMAVFLLAVKRVGNYFVGPPEAIEPPKGFNELSEPELQDLGFRN